MRTRKLSKLLFAAFFSMALTSGVANADSNRMANRFGFYVGVLGDPFPTLVGLNLHYNVFDFMRVVAGYGSIGASGTSGNGTWELSATTIGGGARFFVPDWSFTPTAGINWANVSITATGSAAGQSVGGLSESASHMYLSMGVDWQAGSGFTFGAGYNLSLKSGVGGLPFINLGWAFDWLN